ncbi:MAG TPA: sulfite exporter TauE/SafE family protein [Candidatus Hydrogenedentes bacterium]|nr:sulfite exporter TauE/SafE family protein [Candidatus Hydrogenedentota bacterium]
MPETSHLIAALCIILLAHTVETVTGFGCTVVAVALGAFFMRLENWIATLVVLALVQSAWLILRGWRHIRWGVLLKRIIPCCTLGMPLGFVSFEMLASSALKHVLGGFVVVVAGAELYRLFRQEHAPRPLPEWAGAGLLAGGGFFHGLFASGGPLVVYYASRVIEGKAGFRATLSCLWLALNIGLMTTFALTGRLNDWSLVEPLVLLPALVSGIVLGEFLHGRVNELAFKKAVQVLLFLTGLSLLV